MVLLASLVALTMCTTTFSHGIPAPTPPPPPPPPHNTSPVTPTPSPSIQKKLKGTEEFLRTHNKARAEVGVGPLKWSKKLATDTNRLVRYQRDKMGCQFANMSLTEYGMNQMRANSGGSGKKADPMITPTEAVNLWVEQKKYYDHTSNTCTHHKNCGVYKQVVWKRSTEIGCAQARCPKEHATLTICLYHPPGNVIGQKPY